MNTATSWQFYVLLLGVFATVDVAAHSVQLIDLRETINTELAQMVQLENKLYIVTAVGAKLLVYNTAGNCE